MRRLTPLNIVSGVLLFALAYLFLFPDEAGWRKLGAIPLIVLLFLAFVSDLIFRAAARDLRRIWLFETIFVIFVILFMYLLAS